MFCEEEKIKENVMGNVGQGEEGPGERPQRSQPGAEAGRLEAGRRAQAGTKTWAEISANSISHLSSCPETSAAEPILGVVTRGCGRIA